MRRGRSFEAPVERVWGVVSDPHHLPRWWPRVERVENVRNPGQRRGQWTTVLRTGTGRGVRADYRCTSAAEGERYVWEQLLAGTPFERHLAASTAAVELAAEDGGTRVTIASAQRLRGLSRLGTPMLRRSVGRLLDEALEGLARALGEGRAGD